ncbi:hypothetical protein STENM327S_08379 [Streptomyces tendae]
MTAKPVAAPRPSRARARTTSIAAFVVLAALVPTTATASGTQEVEAEFPYVCTLPSGRLPATVRVSADFPERAGAGEAFTPSDVTTTVELPAEAVADLTARDAAEVRAATRLTVGVAQNAATATATWPGQLEPVTLPASGPLTLVARGEVPSVAGRSDGDLTFSAGALAIDLALGAADPATADPASLPVDCALAEDAPGQGLLATLPVGMDVPGASGSPSPSGPPPASEPAGEGQREAPGDRAPRSSSPSARRRCSEITPGAAVDRDDVPPCRYDEQHPPTSKSLNAYITGYTNVRKQKAASYLPPSCMLIEQGDPVAGPLDPEALVFDTVSWGDFSYRGRKQTPPFRSTFLSFDFVPVTATMVLEQTGPVRINSRLKLYLLEGLTTMDAYVQGSVVSSIRVLLRGQRGAPGRRPGAIPGSSSASSTRTPRTSPVTTWCCSGAASKSPASRPPATSSPPAVCCPARRQSRPSPAAAPAARTSTGCSPPPCPGPPPQGRRARS